MVPLKVRGYFPVCVASNTVGYIASMDRRSDDRIRELCSRILATKDQDELVNLCIRLRKEIQNHVGHLRGRMSEYPFAREKRRNPTESDQES